MGESKKVVSRLKNLLFKTEGQPPSFNYLFYALGEIKNLQNSPTSFGFGGSTNSNNEKVKWWQDYLEMAILLQSPQQANEILTLPKFISLSDEEKKYFDSKLKNEHKDPAKDVSSNALQMADTDLLGNMIAIIDDGNPQVAQWLSNDFRKIVQRETSFQIPSGSLYLDYLKKIYLSLPKIRTTLKLKSEQKTARMVQTRRNLPHPNIKSLNLPGEMLCSAFVDNFCLPMLSQNVPLPEVVWNTLLEQIIEIVRNTNSQQLKAHQYAMDKIKDVLTKVMSGEDCMLSPNTRSLAAAARFAIVIPNATFDDIFDLAQSFLDLYFKELHSPSSTNEKSNTATFSVVQSLRQWVEKTITSHEPYEPGILVDRRFEGSFWTEPFPAENSGPADRGSITTNGKYLYVFSPQTGIIKLGNGLQTQRGKIFGVKKVDIQQHNDPELLRKAVLGESTTLDTDESAKPTPSTRGWIACVNNKIYLAWDQRSYYQYMEVLKVRAASAKVVSTALVSEQLADSQLSTAETSTQISETEPSETNITISNEGGEHERRKVSRTAQEQPTTPTEVAVPSSYELPQVPFLRVFDAETLEEEEPIYDKASQFAELMKKHWCDMTTDGQSLYFFSVESASLILETATWETPIEGQISQLIKKNTLHLSHDNVLCHAFPDAERNFSSAYTFVCNGDKIHVWGKSFVSIYWDIKHSTAYRAHHGKSSQPFGYLACYDPTNNVIWNCNKQLCLIAKWRNTDETPADYIKSDDLVMDADIVVSKTKYGLHVAGQSADGLHCGLFLISSLDELLANESFEKSQLLCQVSVDSGPRMLTLLKFVREQAVKSQGVTEKEFQEKLFLITICSLRIIKHTLAKLPNVKEYILRAVAMELGEQLTEISKLKEFPFNSKAVQNLIERIQSDNIGIFISGKVASNHLMQFFTGSNSSLEIATSIIRKMRSDLDLTAEVLQQDVDASPSFSLLAASLNALFDSQSITQTEKLRNLLDVSHFSLFYIHVMFSSAFGQDTGDAIVKLKPETFVDWIKFVLTNLCARAVKLLEAGNEDKKDMSIIQAQILSQLLPAFVSSLQQSLEKKLLSEEAASSLSSDIRGLFVPLLKLVSERPINSAEIQNLSNSGQLLLSNLKDSGNTPLTSSAGSHPTPSLSAPLASQTGLLSTVAPESTAKIPGATVLHLFLGQECSIKKHQTLKIFNATECIAELNGDIASWPQRRIVITGDIVRLKLEDPKATPPSAFEVSFQVFAQPDWMHDFQITLVDLVCKSAAKSVTMPLIELEKQHKHLVEAKLLHRGIEDAYQKKSMTQILRTEPGELNDDDQFLEDFILNAGIDGKLSKGAAFGQWIYANIIKKSPIGNKGGPEVDSAERAIVGAVLKHSGLIHTAREFADSIYEQIELGSYGNQNQLKPPQTIRSLCLNITKSFRIWLLQQRQMIINYQNETTEDQPISKSTFQTFEQLVDHVVTKARLLIRFRACQQETDADSEQLVASSISLSAHIPNEAPESRAMLHNSLQSRPRSHSKVQREKLIATARNQNLGERSGNSSSGQNRYLLLWNYIQHRKQEGIRSREQSDDSDAYDDESIVAQICSFVENPLSIENLLQVLEVRKQRLQNRKEGLNIFISLLANTNVASGVRDTVTRSLVECLGQLNQSALEAGDEAGKISAPISENITPCSALELDRLQSSVEFLLKYCTKMLQRQQNTTTVTSVLPLLSVWHVSPQFNTSHHSFVQDTKIMEYLHQHMSPLKQAPLAADATFVPGAEKAMQNACFTMFSCLATKWFLEDEQFSDNPTSLQRQVVDLILDELTKLSDKLTKCKTARTMSHAGFTADQTSTLEFIEVTQEYVTVESYGFCMISLLAYLLGVRLVAKCCNSLDVVKMFLKLVNVGSMRIKRAAIRILKRILIYHQPFMLGKWATSQDTKEKRDIISHLFSLVSQSSFSSEILEFELEQYALKLELKEKAAKEQAEKEKAAKEKAEKEQAAKEQAEKEAAEQAAKEQAAKEKTEKEAAEKANTTLTTTPGSPAPLLRMPSFVFGAEPSSATPPSAQPTEVPTEPQETQTQVAITTEPVPVSGPSPAPTQPEMTETQPPQTTTSVTETVPQSSPAPTAEPVQPSQTPAVQAPTSPAPATGFSFPTTGNFSFGVNTSTTSFSSFSFGTSAPSFGSTLGSASLFGSTTTTTPTPAPAPTTTSFSIGSSSFSFGSSTPAFGSGFSFGSSTPAFGSTAPAFGTPATTVAVSPTAPATPQFSFGNLSATAMTTASQPDSPTRRTANRRGKKRIGPAGQVIASPTQQPVDHPTPTVTATLLEVKRFDSPSDKMVFLIPVHNGMRYNEDNGYSLQCLASEIVALLRSLAVDDAWKKPIVSTINDSLSKTKNVFETLKSKINKAESVPTSADPNNNNMDNTEAAPPIKEDIHNLIATLNVLGGHTERLRVGAQVSVLQEDAVRSETGVVIQYNILNNKATVVFMDANGRATKTETLHAKNLVPQSQSTALVSNFFPSTSQLIRDVKPLFGDLPPQAESIQAVYGGEVEKRVEANTKVSAEIKPFEENRAILFVLTQLRTLAIDSVLVSLENSKGKLPAQEVIKHADFLSSLITLANKSKLKNGTRYSVVREQAVSRRFDLVYYFNTHHNNHNLVPHTHGVDKPLPLPLSSPMYDSEGGRLLAITATSSLSHKSFEEVRYEESKYHTAAPDIGPSNENPSPVETTEKPASDTPATPSTEATKPDEPKVLPHNLFINASFPWPSDLLSMRQKETTTASTNIPGTVVFEKKGALIPGTQVPTDAPVGVVVSVVAERSLVVWFDAERCTAEISLIPRTKLEVLSPQCVGFSKWSVSTYGPLINECLNGEMCVTSIAARQVLMKLFELLPEIVPLYVQSQKPPEVKLNHSGKLNESGKLRRSSIRQSQVIVNENALPEIMPPITMQKNPIKISTLFGGRKSLLRFMAAMATQDIVVDGCYEEKDTPGFPVAQHVFRYNPISQNFHMQLVKYHLVQTLKMEKDLNLPPSQVTEPLIPTRNPFGKLLPKKTKSLAEMCILYCITNEYFQKNWEFKTTTSWNESLRGFDFASFLILSVFANGLDWVKQRYLGRVFLDILRLFKNERIEGVQAAMLQVLLHLIENYTEDLRKQFDIPTQVGRIVATAFTFPKPLIPSLPTENAPAQPPQVAVQPQPIETAEQPTAVPPATAPQQIAVQLQPVETAPATALAEQSTPEVVPQQTVAQPVETAPATAPTEQPTGPADQPTPTISPAEAQPSPTSATPALVPELPSAPTLLRVSEADKKKREGSFPVLPSDLAYCAAEIPTPPEYVPNNLAPRDEFQTFFEEVKDVVAAASKADGIGFMLGQKAYEATQYISEALFFIYWVLIPWSPVATDTATPTKKLDKILEMGNFVYQFASNRLSNKYFSVMYLQLRRGPTSYSSKPLASPQPGSENNNTSTAQTPPAENNQTTSAPEVQPPSAPVIQQPTFVFGTSPAPAAATSTAAIISESPLTNEDFQKFLTDWTHEHDLLLMECVKKTLKTDAKDRLLEPLSSLPEINLEVLLDRYPDMAKKPNFYNCIQMRYAMIQRLNRIIDKEILSQYLQNKASESIVECTRLHSYLCNLSHIIFLQTKLQLFNETLNTRFNNGGRTSRCKISRLDAEMKKDAIFLQIFRQLNFVPTEDLQNRDRAWQVEFQGEGASDAGGPYRYQYQTDHKADHCCRECISHMCQELQSDALKIPLLIQCPNAKEGTGQNIDQYVINPSGTIAAGFAYAVASDSYTLQQFEWLGKLMAIAIRTGNPLNLDLSSFVWKQLVGTPLSPKDILHIDVRVSEILKGLAKGELINESNIRITFTTKLSDNTEVELKPNGKNILVTAENVTEYIQLVEAKRLRECEKQIAAIRDGMGKLIPAEMLGMFTWDQLEELVCGKPDVDIEAMKKFCNIKLSSNCRSSFLEEFWECLQSFTTKERCLFIRFACGLSRLPNGYTPSKHLKIVIENAEDTSLPRASTCFWTIYIPNYSTKDIMRNRLHTAITHCTDIDADYTI